MKPSKEPWIDHEYAGPLSVSEMGAVVGLSRSQFGEYVRRGVMPPPVYDLQTRRPYYTLDLQRVVIGVRQSRIGINGQYVLFYVRRQQERAAFKPKSLPVRPQTAASSLSLIDDLQRAMGELGLSNVTKADVERAVVVAFPGGVPSDLGSALQPVFLELRRRGIR